MRISVRSHGDYNPKDTEWDSLRGTESALYRCNLAKMRRIMQFSDAGIRSSSTIAVYVTEVVRNICSPPQGTPVPLYSIHTKIDGTRAAQIHRLLVRYRGRPYLRAVVARGLKPLAITGPAPCADSACKRYIQTHHCARQILIRPSKDRGTSDVT